MIHDTFFDTICFKAHDWESKAKESKLNLETLKMEELEYLR